MSEVHDGDAGVQTGLRALQSKHSSSCLHGGQLSCENPAWDRPPNFQKGSRKCKISPKDVRN
eukprot:2323523-Amphidinium_carterae.1